MSDFIREVDEDYRRERFFGFLRRFQVPLALLVVAVIAGAGGYRWYVDHHAAVAANANDRYQQAERAAREGHAADAERDFHALAGNGPGGYAVLSRIRAAEVAAARDPAEAARNLDAIASDAAAGSPALRDLARFRGALLRADRQDPKAFEAQYGRFAVEAFTFRDGIRELLALAALKRGDGAAAEKYLDAIIVDPVAPPALRNRAQAVRELAIGGPTTVLDHQPGPASVVPLAPAGGATTPVAPQAAAPQSTEGAASTESAPLAAASAPTTAPPASEMPATPDVGPSSPPSPPPR